MSRRRRARSEQPASAPTTTVRATPRYALWGVLGALVLALLGAGGWLLSRQTASAQRVVPTLIPGASGPAACRALPPLVQQQGFAEARTVFTTAERRLKGLVMLDSRAEPTADGLPGRFYQHPTWTNAGYLGPLAFFGPDIYVAPVPRISLVDNPPAQQATIWRVDGASGTMQPWAEVPRGGPPTPENPFGILGMAVDCQTASLYVSSVAGSTRAKEIGRLVRYDLLTGAVLSQAEGIDAIGLAVHRTPRGQRLVFGTARASLLKSVELDAAGNFTTNLREEAQLAPLAGGTDMKARRIMIAPNGTLSVAAITFNYTVIVASELPTATFEFTYDPQRDGWTPALNPASATPVP